MSNNLSRGLYRYALYRQRKKVQIIHRGIAGIDMKLNMVL